MVSQRETAQAQRWQTAAPVAAGFPELRQDNVDPDDRRELFMDFSEAADDAGIDIGGWGRRRRGDDEPDDGWERDYE